MIADGATGASTREAPQCGSAEGELRIDPGEAVEEFFAHRARRG